jgi:hypothetical protein
MVHFGVDSTGAVNRLLSTVVTALKKPAFWGRYVTGYPVTTAELQFLGANGIKLLPVYQATTAHPQSLQTASQGQSDAHAAMSAATACGIPSHHGIALYADIERGYGVTAAWLSAWTSTVQSGGFVPAVYCASDDAASPGIVSAYGALTHEQRTVLLVWSNAPALYDSSVWSAAQIPESIGGVPVTAGGGSHVPNVWQYAIPGGTNPNQPVDLDVCDDAAFAAMWLPPS